MESLIVATADQLREIFREELEQYHKSNTQPIPQEAGLVIFNLDQLCNYAGLSKQTVYKLTGRGLIPHSKRGKRLFFEKNQVDAWLLENKRATVADIKKEADEYLRTKRRGRL